MNLSFDGNGLLVGMQAETRGQADVQGAMRETDFMVKLQLSIRRLSAGACPTILVQSFLTDMDPLEVPFRCPRRTRTQFGSVC